VDHSGNQWATAFNEEAEVMVNASAQELGELKERDNDAYLEKIGASAFKSYVFKLRLRLETFNVCIYSIIIFIEFYLKNL
jgi:replication factor A1